MSDPGGLAYVIGSDFVSIRGTTIPGLDGPVAAYEVKREWVTYRNLCADCVLSTPGTKTKVRDLDVEFNCDEHELARTRGAA